MRRISNILSLFGLLIIMGILLYYAFAIHYIFGILITGFYLMIIGNLLDE